MQLFRPGNLNFKFYTDCRLQRLFHKISSPAEKVGKSEGSFIIERHTVRVEMWGWYWCARGTCRTDENADCFDVKGEIIPIVVTFCFALNDNLLSDAKGLLTKCRSGSKCASKNW